MNPLKKMLRLLRIFLCVCSFQKLFHGEQLYLIFIRSQERKSIFQQVDGGQPACISTYPRAVRTWPLVQGVKSRPRCSNFHVQPNSAAVNCIGSHSREGFREKELSGEFISVIWEMTRMHKAALCLNINMHVCHHVNYVKPFSTMCDISFSVLF